MRAPERVYRGSVRLLSVIFVVLGTGILASTLVNGGGPLSLGTFLGLAFIAVGVARLWIARRV